MEGASEPGQEQGPACGEAHLRGGREAGTGQWLAGSQQPAEEKEPGKGGTQRTSTLIPGSRRSEVIVGGSESGKNNAPSEES